MSTESGRGFDGGMQFQPSPTGALPPSFVPNMPYNPTFSPTGNTPTLGGQFSPTGFPAPPPTFSPLGSNVTPTGTPTGLGAPTSGIPGTGGSPYLPGLFSPFGKY